MRWLLGALLALLAWPAGAAALDFPDARPTARPDVLAARDFAVTFWADRDVTGCPAGIAVYVAPSLYSPLDGVDATGRGWPCRVALSTPHLRKWARPWATRGAELLCTVMIHEVGHALGLRHSDDPGAVMHFPSVAPYECRRLRGHIASAHRARWFQPSWMWSSRRR